MVIVLTLIASACLLAVMVVYLTHRRAKDLREHAIQIQELGQFPIAAFQNLADPSELQYLQTRLPKGVFERCRRQRSLVLIGYVHLILKNTRVILRCADVAVASSDPAVSEPANDLLNLALQTRLNALKALVLLYAGILIPSVSCNLTATLMGYSVAHEKSFGLSTRILR